ncbi:CDP-archaeol synthase [Aquisalimonas sp.]|uniref:CDP-archaeol synthase n=1 Tax=Aquisalimonas sp. TaxID=1872621 RepID=UPI0025BDD1BE|nr:CDP-archaeol synthase [Aquisalimonas sp.]
MIATLDVLLLIVAANAAPVTLKLMLRQEPAWPVDGGLQWRDGRRLFGASKSIRGVVAAIIAAAAVAWIVGLPILAGAAAGAMAMTGDLLSSFTKRRLGLEPSSRFLGLDQVPEAFFPLLVLIPLTEVELWNGLSAALLFVVLGPPLSWLLYHAGIRREPH